MKTEADEGTHAGHMEVERIVFTARLRVPQLLARLSRLTRYPPPSCAYLPFFFFSFCPSLCTVPFISAGMEMSNAASGTRINAPVHAGTFIADYIHDSACIPLHPTYTNTTISIKKRLYARKIFVRAVIA